MAEKWVGGENEAMVVDMLCICIKFNYFFKSDCVWLGEYQNMVVVVE